jgi:hypothetical protein
VCRFSLSAINHSSYIVDVKTEKSRSKSGSRWLIREIPDASVDIRRFFRTIESGETTDSYRQWLQTTCPDDLYRCFGVSG